MTELHRIEQEYQRRAQDQSLVARYSELAPDNQFNTQSRERARAALLRRMGRSDLGNTRILDVGCGGGGELLRWISCGAAPEHCAGVDLMPARVERARKILPAAVRVQQGDASHLPHDSGSFDIVAQYTVFTSILDRDLKRAIAAEMLRVLKPDGLIVWYDFWLNPVNKATKGIRMPEIKALFPGCHFDATLLTLAPPVARMIAPRSMLLASLLELLPLRSHWLVGIRKRT